jgi:uncharacterized lipoprotein YddW (UPF0748 family)
VLLSHADATFFLDLQGVYPSYFTYRQEPSSTVWKEEEKIRNIEPALASQLELNRLSNFNVTPIFVENRQIRSSLFPSSLLPSSLFPLPSSSLHEALD